MVKAAVAVTDGAVPAAVIDDLVDAGLAMLTETVRLLPDVPAVLADLSRDHRLVLITKGDLVHQTRKVETSGIAHHFEQIEVVLEKDPATYERILRQVGVDAGALLHGRQLGAQRHPARARPRRPRRAHPVPAAVGARARRPRRGPRRAGVDQGAARRRCERTYDRRDGSTTACLASLRRDAAALLEARPRRRSRRARAVRARAGRRPTSPGTSARSTSSGARSSPTASTTPDAYVQSPRPETFDDTVTFAESTAAGAARRAASRPIRRRRCGRGASDKTAGFVLRRMAHETAVHRLDAERAAGREHTIDADLASDGIDEFLFEFLVWVDGRRRAARRLRAPALHRRRR